MNRSLTEMTEIVDELLAWARMDAGSIERRSTPLHSLVDDVVAGFAELADALSIDVTCTDDVVALDQRAARHVLRNLLGNAIRYADERIEVRVVRDDGFVRIEVDDDGPGVARSDRDRIFDPFVTLDPARSNARGAAGLGLAIVDRVARAHGGSARCDASTLGGARFTVTLGTVSESTENQAPPQMH
jgi:two-component system sensor histidine kinase RstB